MSMLIKKIYNRLFKSIKLEENPIQIYIKNGRKPWAKGYVEYKEKYIDESLNSIDVLNCFKSDILPNKFGIGIDDRSVEYPWIFSNLEKGSEKMLDAGSTFNFRYIIDKEVLKDKDITIYTYYPEGYCYFQDRISYVYGDLRDLCFKNDYFDTIVSQSTIEHIDMDNTIYGYSNKTPQYEKSYEYLKAINEMIRVLKPNGKLLITFPYGKFENHGFFQQFDEEMFERLLENLLSHGKVEKKFFKYEQEGWRFAIQDELNSVVSYNPHTGRGKDSDGAAHSRAIACIKFIKH